MAVRFLTAFFKGGDMEYKKIAYVQEAYALKGQVKIILLSDNISYRFASNQVCYYLENNQYLPLTIEQISHIKDNKAILKFKEFNDINQIEFLLKRDLYATKIEDDSIVYLDDLINFKVVDEQKNELGLVSDYQIIANKNYLVVNKKLIPLIKDIFYSRIDTENKTIYLTSLGVEVYYNA